MDHEYGSSRRIGEFVSIADIVQIAALAGIVLMGVCVVSAAFEMRKLHEEQRSKLAKAITAVEQIQKLQPEFLSVLQRVQSDGHALQKVALQIEVSVEALRSSLGSALHSATERQTGVIHDLRNHLDMQEERLAAILQSISENLHGMQQAQAAAAMAKPQDNGSNGNGKGPNGNYVWLRKEIVSQDPQVRFSVLKDWVTRNSLAIQHRASRSWTSPTDLIATVPQQFEPVAEITPDQVLLVSTQGYPEKIAIRLNDSDATGHEILSRRTDA